jgi:hypothetical protein
VKRGDGSLCVVVYYVNNRSTLTYGDISAVGIGHIKKDLVLVPADDTKEPFECGTDWASITIDKEIKL